MLLHLFIYLYNRKWADVFNIDGFDAIFTVDHVLSIQQLSSHYLLEYERKKGIVKSIISADFNPAEHDHDSVEEDDVVASDKSSSLSSIPLPWIKSEEIDKIISTWGDDSDQSIIDTEAGNQFLSVVW